MERGGRSRRRAVRTRGGRDGNGGGRGDGTDAPSSDLSIARGSRGGRSASGQGRGRGRGRGLEPIAEAAKFFCGTVSMDGVVGIPEGSAMHSPLHQKRPRRWNPDQPTPTPQSPTPSSPVTIYSVPLPAAFVDCEMSPRASLSSSLVVTGDHEEPCKESPPSSPVTSRVATDENDMPFKKKRLAMGISTSPQSGRALPLQEWQISELVNDGFGSEDEEDEDGNNGEDGLLLPMSSFVSRKQKMWLDDIFDMEEPFDPAPSPQLQHSSLQVPSPSLVALAETASPPPRLPPPDTIEGYSSPPPPQQSSHNSPSPPPETLTAPCPHKPESMWEFDWRVFADTNLPAPRERMEDFNQPTGPVRSYDRAYDVFNSIWDRQILQRIVDETNNYAQLLTARQIDEGTLEKSSRISLWQDLTIDELLVYFALMISMGLVVKSNIREYWASQGEVTDTPNFGRYMSVNRFANITRAMHFNDNLDPILHTLSRPKAKLFKIQPIIDHLNEKFQTLYSLSREVALDESLTEWKGWLDINQFIKNKAANIGIKSYEVCDSRTGYLWRFKIYAGREHLVEQDVSPVSGITSQIVLELVHDLEHRGHVLFMDNYYNSPALSRCLKSRGFDVVGTLRPNRQFVPSEFKMPKTQMAPGHVYGTTSGDVDIILWRDQNKVYMTSTYHGMSQFSRDGKQKPSVIHDYNVCMGGVDRKDQMLSMYPLERKRTRVWYKKLFRRLLNVSILNAFILLKGSTEKLQHRQFRRDLIKQLLDIHAPAVTVPRPRPLTTSNFKFSAAVVNHFPLEYGVIPGQANRRIRRSCVKCHQRTFTHCPTCQVALCLIRCFVEYHT